MATKGNKPSVIAKLMGLEEAPLKQQPVSGLKRVLSENYLQKSVSLGTRERRSSKIRQKSREILKKSNSTLNDSSKDVSLRHIEKRNHSFDSHSTFGWEFKKQLLERSKRAKVCQGIRSGIRVCKLGEVPSMADVESNQRLELTRRVTIRRNEGWKDKSVTKSPILKPFDISKFKRVSKRDLRSSSVNVEFPCGDEGIKQINENEECNGSAKEECLPCSSDVSFEQDSPCEDGFMSINCIEIDDELRSNTIEVYQPSPNSVLEPDNSSISEYDENVSTDLHGLWMKLQDLKSESEKNRSKPEIVTSSYGDSTEIRFGPKESREFSYLINVLSEIGSFERWHSVEHIMSPLNFEKLEKKFAKQMQESWNTADRRLLFDRIKLGLSEILRSYVDFIVYSKLLRRKMSTGLRRDVIEEELWNVLVSERDGVNADLSEKAVGKEPWLEVGEELDAIVGEIEGFLFNELVLELVDF